MPDSTDKKLVRLLGQNARQNSETLAKRLNISAATVRRKLRKLINSDALRIVGLVDPSKFGFPLAVMIALDIEHDKLELALDMLVNRPEVKWVSPTTGRFDIIAIARYPSTESFSDFMIKELAHMEGVKNSETFICLDVKKGHYGALA
ncbi:Lrp/AsnC family transcriptional regulator [Chloroflexota bacterium]